MGWDDEAGFGMFIAARGAIKVRKIFDTGVRLCELRGSPCRIYDQSSNIDGR